MKWSLELRGTSEGRHQGKTDEHHERKERRDAKGDPTADLMKLGAKEVKDGAIIVRVGEKLYLVDADPSAKSFYTGWAGEAFGRGPGGG